MVVGHESTHRRYRDGLGCLSNVKFDAYSDMCATTKWCGFCDLTTKRRCPPIPFSLPVRIPDHLAFRGCDVKLAYGVCIYLVRVVRPPVSRFPAFTTNV